MTRIAHVTRRGARYVFRRRIHFQNIISRPLALALQTADPSIARQRAAILSARFEVVKSSVRRMIEQGTALTGPQIEALFRQELESELRAIVDFAFSDGAWADEALRIASDDREKYGFLRSPDRHRPEFVELALGLFPDEMVTQRLAGVGASTGSSNIAVARTHLIRARAVAGAKIQNLYDDEAMDAPDPIAVLMGEFHDPSQATLPLPATAVVPAENTQTPKDVRECKFDYYDERRFSEIIEEVAADLKTEGIWSGKLDQQRRIMRTFAWITGDRELGSYTHRDVAAFKKALLKLPKRFKFGTPQKGAMSRPFDQIARELASAKSGEPRSKKTVNRDLSTMSTVAKHLEQTAWKPKIEGSKVMNFAGATIGIKEGKSTELRPVWTKEHLRCLFTSPIFTGGGAGKKRLKNSEHSPRVWHDAAYFAPLLWYYTHACREEICGIEIADVFADVPVPFIWIRNNKTRGVDGEMAGEKRPARRREIPIHPELIRLGFLQYVEKIRQNGHTEVFPELYLQQSKRGGAQFYYRAWTHMVDWIEDRMTIPIDENGKKTDIHSIRALGSSFYEVEGVNPIMRADLMGHEREGTNARHYSKRVDAEGLSVVLGERLQMLCKYVPVITDHLNAAPISFLPLDSRSRVGSGRPRKARSDAGTSKSKSGN
ncbi:hypothetical protein K3179_00310 [Qipengyuania sp. GH38]|uniref:hypothetical protein n=1 Tax=Qipengyuania intermedia TaxID=2867244 RepID=UPI001C869A35|nr:hypothetical protein [Qipengyuania intermedia]MBX7512980.1 hypothetical protein [Qipengyuania intermedia]